ncbi:MAG TPA: hypothetical protein VGK59_20200 [Ohtaekwangia sp.]
MTGKSVTSLFSSYKKELLWLFLIFLVSRVLAFAAGMEFDSWGIRYGAWQLINPELLKDRLGESLFYLHSQPPLFNLFTGIVLKLFPEHYTEAFLVVHMTLGIAIIFTLFAILKQVGVRTWIAFSITVLYAISPSTILYENWESYTYIIIALLTFSSLSLLFFVQTGKSKYGFALFSFMACLILTRSMYHIIWFVAVIALLMILRFTSFKTILKTALIPFIIVIALFAKNYFVFGVFGSSSWFGMSLSEIVLAKLPEEKKNKLIASGEISELSRKPAFWSIDNYAAFVHKKNPYPHIRVLTDTTNLSHPNLHNYHFIEVSDAYKKDAVKAATRYPMDYLKNVVISFGYYFHSAGNHYDLRFNRPHLFWYNKIYNHIILGAVINPDELELEPPFQPRYLLTTSFVIVLFYAVSTMVLISFVLRTWRDKSVIVQRTILLFAALTVVYVMLIGNLFEQGENMRFRFETIILCLIILGFTLERITDKYFPVKAVND